MSGSGGTFRPDTTPCHSVDFEVKVSSPQANVSEKVSVGDILDIKIVELNNIQVLAFIWNGEILGGITGGRGDTLNKCIKSGYNFQGEIISIDIASIIVNVRNK